jgi:YfiH family protein
MRLPEPFVWQGEHIAVQLPGARALFTTRRGGCSRGPYATLNLGRLTGDEEDAVRRNRERVAELIGLPLVGVRQVHSRTVRRLTRPPDPDEPWQEADGQATALSGVAPMVLVADCLPVVLAVRGALAVLHVGWRGLAAGVIAEGARAVRELGTGGELHAAVGPGAGPCCYRVGEEVHARFVRFGDQARRGRSLDLKTIACAQLREEGAAAVHDVGLCTICADPGLFFSHRRDRGLTGRQAGIAWLS